MPAAASIAQAIQLTPENVQLARDSSDDLFEVLGNFITLVKAIDFNEEDAGNRTVTDWLVPLLALQQYLTTYAQTVIFSGPSDVAPAIDGVGRIMWAVLGARQLTPARISLAQSNAMLAAYNATWGSY